MDKFKIKNLKLIMRDENYFLCVSRLVDYKRLDIAIEACNELKLPLKIVGIGLASKSLEKMAGPTIEFLGNLTDSELIEYYQGCRALLFPQEEDFGITAVEVLSCGKPVFGYKSGGAVEIIKEGITGELFSPQSSEALVELIHRVQHKKYDENACRLEAERFSKITFKKQFASLVVKEWEQFKKGNSI